MADKSSFTLSPRLTVTGSTGASSRNSQQVGAHCTLTAGEKVPCFGKARPPGQDGHIPRSPPPSEMHRLPSPHLASLRLAEPRSRGRSIVKGRGVVRRGGPQTLAHRLAHPGTLCTRTKKKKKERRKGLEERTRAVLQNILIQNNVSRREHALSYAVFVSITEHCRLAPRRCRCAADWRAHLIGRLIGRQA